MLVLWFSDGHVGEYREGNVDPATGYNTRLLDTLRVWDWALELAVERRVDFVVFAGDRFQLQRVPSWMRDLADAKLAAFARRGIRIACCLGNHDIFDKAAKHHSWQGAQVWNDSPLITIFDKPGSMAVGDITFHFLPYGFKELGYEVAPGRNILVFHDEVRGMSSYGGPRIAEHGLEPSVVDRPEFMAVFGGHIHLRQELPLQHTVGLHIGTPLERVADGDQGEKGALISEITDEVALEFVESPLPKIITGTIEWTEEPDISKLDSIAGNVVLLTVTHDGSATPRWRRKLEEALCAVGAMSACVDLSLSVGDDQPKMEDVQVTLPIQAPLADQLLSYAESTHGDSLIPYLREILSKVA